MNETQENERNQPEKGASGDGARRDDAIVDEASVDKVGDDYSPADDAADETTDEHVHAETLSASKADKSSIRSHRHRSGRRSGRSSRKPRAQAALPLVRLLSLVAIGLSGYLAFLSFGSSGPAGCGGDGAVDCEHVIQTRWSAWLGIPVSAVAVAVYAGIFVLSWNLDDDRRRRVLFRSLAITAGLAAIWFTGLQLAAIQKICTYCLAVHACGISIAGLVILHAHLNQSRRRSNRLSWLGQPATLAVTAMGALILGQVIFKPAEFEVLDDGPVTGSALAANADNTSNESGVAGSDSKNAVPGDALTGDQVPGDTVPGNTVPDDKVPGETVPGDAEKSASETKGSTNNTPPVNQFANDLARRVKSDDPKTTTPSGETDSRAANRDAPKQPEVATVSILQGKLKLDLSKYPLLGKPDADDILVKMFDYACPQCRNLERQVEQVKAESQSSISVFVDTGSHETGMQSVSAEVQ